MIQVAALLAALGGTAPNDVSLLALVVVPPSHEQVPAASEALLLDLLQQLGVRSELRHLPPSTIGLAEQVDASRALAQQSGAAVVFVVALPRPARVLVYLPARGSSGRDGRLLVRDIAAASSPESALEGVATVLRSTVNALLDGARVELPGSDAPPAKSLPQADDPPISHEIRAGASGTVDWLDGRLWLGASVAAALSRRGDVVPWGVELSGDWQPAQSVHRAQTAVDIARQSLSLSAMLHGDLGPLHVVAGVFGSIEWIQLHVRTQPAWVITTHDEADRFMSTGPVFRLEWPRAGRWQLSVEARLAWLPATSRYLVATPDGTDVALDLGRLHGSLGLGLWTSF